MHGWWEDVVDILRGKAPMGELPKQIAPWIPNRPRQANTLADRIDPSYTEQSHFAKSLERGTNKLSQVLEGSRKKIIEGLPE